MNPSSPTNVAIACQGGGSHTAFTAGVLQHLLNEQGSDYRISAISGTSGGALCAFVAWYGLRTGGSSKAISSLDVLWESIKAKTYSERVANRSLVWSSRLLEMGFPVLQISPSANLFSKIGQEGLRQMLESFVDNKPLENMIFDEQPEGSSQSLPPKILVSAVDANDGSFDIFTDRPKLELSTDECSGTDSGIPSFTRYLEEPPRPLTIDAVVASAAVPTVFEGVRMNGPDRPSHLYWDGLFSQNPPIRNFLSGPVEKDQKPSEIWLVRINPTRRRGTFTTLEEIADRRNELTGNLSLYQELFFIKRVNEWLSGIDCNEPMFKNVAAEKYREVTVREIELSDRFIDQRYDLTLSTKLNRDPDFINHLMQAGEQQAIDFLKDQNHYTIINSDGSIPRRSRSSICR